MLRGGAKDNILYEKWTELALYIHVRRLLPPYTITPPGYHFYHRLGGNKEEGGKLLDQIKFNKIIKISQCKSKLERKYLLISKKNCKYWWMITHICIIMLLIFKKHVTNDCWKCIFVYNCFEKTVLQLFLLRHIKT